MAEYYLEVSRDYKLENPPRIKSALLFFDISLVVLWLFDHHVVSGAMLCGMVTLKRAL